MKERNQSKRAQRTRSALIEAGLSLLAERPVDAIAIDDLVQAARVAKGSFFNHFADKHQFADEISRRIREEFEARVDVMNALEDDPVARMTVGMVLAALLGFDEPGRATILSRTARGPTQRDHRLNHGLAEDVREAVARRLIDTPSERAAFLFWLGLCETLMGAVVEQARALDDVFGMTSQMLAVGLRGLGVSPEKVARLSDVNYIAARVAVMARACGGSPRAAGQAARSGVDSMPSSDSLRYSVERPMPSLRATSVMRPR